MSEYYAVVDYDQLKDGEDILAFGCHVLSWDFSIMGKPSYGIVPVKCDTDALQAEIARLRAALAGMLLAFPVDVYRMLAGHPNCDMERADVAVTKARAALKGGE